MDPSTSKRMNQVKPTQDSHQTHDNLETRPHKVQKISTTIAGFSGGFINIPEFAGPTPTIHSHSNNHHHQEANSTQYLKDDGKWGLGAIFRDSEGNVLASATWVMPGFNDPATAEACALYHTMRLAMDCCFTCVEFESDCSVVVNRVNELDASPRNYLGNFIQGIRNNRNRFHLCSFAHIHRQANIVAHELASLAHYTLDSVWLEETHQNIVPFVLMDLI